jgi:hypothetical protein
LHELGSITPVRENCKGERYNDRSEGADGFKGCYKVRIVAEDNVKPLKPFWHRENSTGLLKSPAPYAHIVRM